MAGTERDILFQGFLPFADLSKELQEKINTMGDYDVFFFEGEPREDDKKDIKNAVLLGKRGFLFLDALNNLVWYPADHKIGQILLTDLARYLLAQPNLDFDNMIKNLRSLADFLAARPKAPVDSAFESPMVNPAEPPNADNEKK